MSVRYSDFDIVQNEARFIAKGNNIIAIPVKSYSTFFDIEQWYTTEENQKIISDLLNFPQTKKGVLWQHQFPQCFCISDTDLTQLLVNECFVSLNLADVFPEGYFDTFIQCSWCGGLTFGKYGASRDYFGQRERHYPTPQHTFLVNWCAYHKGAFRYNSGYSCPSKNGGH
jgi:hypothetical protein